MQYQYRLKNILTLDEKSLQKFKHKISKIQGVLDATYQDEHVILQVDKNVYEYDVLQLLISLADEFDVEVIFGEEDEKSYDDTQKSGDNGLIGEDLGQDSDENEQNNGDDLKDTQNQKVKPEKAQKVLKKEEVKKDMYIRIAELTISLIMLIVAVFFAPKSDDIFSLRMILIILSFALSIYEVVFSYFEDVVSKNYLTGNIIATLCAIVLIVLGQPVVATAFALIYSASQFISQTLKKFATIKLNKVFDTGDDEVTINGETGARQDINAGDTVKILAGDTIPTDGVLLCDCQVNTFRFGQNKIVSLSKGDTCLAGYVLLTESASYTSSCAFSESKIDNKKREFIDTTNQSLNTKKVAKIGLYADLSVLFVGLLITFILPIFGSTYADGLQKWGLVGTCVFAICMVGQTLLNLTTILNYTMISSREYFIEYKDVKSLFTLAKANSLKVSASALVDDGKLKEDSLGALNELHYFGIKNVVTQFDCQLDSEVKKQIDFVENPVSKENQIYFGNGEGDIALNGGNVSIIDGEIYNVPVAYRLSKKAIKLLKFSLYLSIIVKVLCLVGLFVLPFNVYNVAYFILGGAATNLVISLLTKFTI